MGHAPLGAAAPDIVDAGRRGAADLGIHLGREGRRLKRHGARRVFVVLGHVWFPQ